MILKNVELSDRDFVNKKLAERSDRGCDYCFGNMFMWKEVYQTKIAEVGDMLLVSGDNEGEFFLPPIGGGDMMKGLCSIIDYFKEKDMPASITCANKQDVELIESLMPDFFTVEETRDVFDYIHLTESLSELKGKSFHGKKGHVNKFKSKYNYEYRPLTKDLLPAVFEMNVKWCRQHAFCDGEETSDEMCATRALLDNFDTLNVIGGVILVDGVVAGFSAGTPKHTGSDTFIVHAEKGLVDYEGIYSALNNMFMTDIMEQGFAYANREEDLGISGLRKSKLSYNPEILLEKYKLTGR